MEKYEVHPKIVAATKDGKTEYWAVASLQEYAVDNVRAELGSGWQLSLTNRRLDLEQARALLLTRNTLRKLPADAKFLG